MRSSMQKSSVNKRIIFIYLSVLTLFFIFIEIGVFISQSDFYLSDYRLVADHLKIPWAILPGIIYFFSVQLGIHIIYALFIAYNAIVLQRLFHLTQAQFEKVSIALWVLGIITILTLNQTFFPNTKFALLTFVLVRLGLLQTVLTICLILSFILIAMTLYGTLLNKHTRLALCLIVVIGAGAMGFNRLVSMPRTYSGEQPNVILIGVDALRPDFLSYFGSNLKTVHFDRFLNHATVFSESLTPLARTFPAWISILSGLHPKVSDVRTDLADNWEGVDFQQTLPAILKKHGYETIFATDEVRFSNLTKELGFDEIVSPPAGFNDFLIGTLNDFPLSNLLVNTPLGPYLFPYSYANRAVYITYDPNTFIKELRGPLQKSRKKPLFFAVHFCLAHYPYAWAGLRNTRHFLQNYRLAIQRVDLQVYDLLKLLKANHLLEHSIVILLSDHGEAMELAGDRITEKELFIAGNHAKKGSLPHFYPPSVKNEAINQSAGHGTDVLGLSQYHNVLAFRLFGLQSQVKKSIPGVVSLLDIKPTILDLLNIPYKRENSNRLADFILGKETQGGHPVDFFFESDFSPAAVRTIHPETRKLLFQGIDYFEINPVTTQLTVKKHMLDLIISSKQYADLYQHWVLALYPQSKDHMMPILVNLETGKWTNDLTTSFAKNSPVAHMLRALKQFYGADISNVDQYD